MTLHMGISCLTTKAIHVGRALNVLTDMSGNFDAKAYVRYVFSLVNDCDFFGLMQNANPVFSYPPMLFCFSLCPFLSVFC
jgi:hypothetical protein